MSRFYKVSIFFVVNVLFSTIVMAMSNDKCDSFCKVKSREKTTRERQSAAIRKTQSQRQGQASSSNFVTKTIMSTTKT